MKGTDNMNTNKNILKAGLAVLAAILCLSLLVSCKNKDEENLGGADGSTGIVITDSGNGGDAP